MGRADLVWTCGLRTAAQRSARRAVSCHADPPSPDDGQALLRVESFGLTSNNITYAVFGEAMKYWDFFPASDPGWGKLNVWGYARVEESRHPDLAQGMRVYGYLPCAEPPVGRPGPHQREGVRRRRRAPGVPAVGVPGLPRRRDRPRLLGRSRGRAHPVLSAVLHVVPHRRLPRRRRLLRRGHNRDLQRLVENGDHRGLPPRQARGHRGHRPDLRGQPGVRQGARRLRLGLRLRRRLPAPRRSCRLCRHLGRRRRPQRHPRPLR